MERIQETDEGYYVQNGDVLEWKWKDEPSEPKKAEPEPKRTTRRRKAKK